MLPETQIYRKNIFEEYTEMVTEFIRRMTGDDPEKIRKWVQELCRFKYAPKKMRHIKTIKVGTTKLVEDDLYAFIERFRDKIITPSGSVYYSSGQKMSFISQMMADKLAERKKVKKKMLNEKAVGNFIQALFYHYQQANIKINTNALTGGLASPYNIMYDKGSYNGITSSARSMITRVNYIAECLLMGNHCWFHHDELVNHIILNTRIRPSDEEIRAMVKKYNLKVPTHAQLKEFYTTTLRAYLPLVNMDKIYRLVDALSVEEVTFLWYYCNLVHLMHENDFAKPFIASTMDISNVQPIEGVTPEDGWKLDPTVVAISAVTYSDALGGYTQKQICEEHHEYLPKFVAYTKFLEAKLHSLDDLFKTFIWTDADIPEVKSKPAMRRGVVVISDTDSTIFTCQSFDVWYKGGYVDKLDDVSRHIAGLCVYWLHHTVAHALYRFSTYFGVDPSQRTRLNMKNEYTYNCLLLYPVKKTYAAICSIQEGVKLVPPQPDVKGGLLRSSSVPKPCLKFVEDLLVDDILKPAMEGKISANYLIKKTADFEREMIRKIRSGSTEFMKVTSLSFEHEYKNPERTPVIVAHRLWEEVFARKYGSIQPPLKVPSIPVNQPGREYFNWLQKTSPDIFNRLTKYLSVKGSIPNNLIINPVLESIPEEIRPLIDIRGIVHNAMRPTYLTLGTLKISAGNEDVKLLLSDVYGDNTSTLFDDEVKQAEADKKADEEKQDK